MSIFQELVIRVLLVLMSLHGANSASLQAEQSSEAVKIKVYRMDGGKWASKLTVFQSNVASHANQYCADSPSSCGLTFWDPSAIFNASSVMASAVAAGKDLEVSTYILFPAGANISSVSMTLFAINKVATKAIITNIRVSIEQAVGAYVTYVGVEYYGIPPSNLANRAIIPIAFIVVFVVCITAIVLHFWNKRKNRRKHKKKLEIASSKVTPIKHGAMGKNIDTHHNLKGSNVNNTEKEVHQMQKVTPSHVPYSTHTPPAQSVNEFVVDETQHNALPPSLPPLSKEEGDSEQRKDKKRKKKKKKRHHRDSEETYQSDSEKTRKQSSKSQEHTNAAFESVYDSDCY